MKLNILIRATLSAVMASLALPAGAQETPVLPSSAADSPSAPSAPPETSPSPPIEPPVRSAHESEAIVKNAPASGDAISTDLPPVDRGPVKIGAKLSPLVLTAGLGYAYATVTHPDLVGHALSGAFIELAVGTELDERFRLSLAFTSFETKIRRTSAGQWEEGEFRGKAVSALRATADPVEPIAQDNGGVEVQKTLHAHSLGPRMDFLPLGSQGPYLGLTTGIAIFQDLGTRVGADLGARIGGEWRPFHSLGLAVEAGAHGQIYGDATAAIPYALARLNLLLEPDSLRSSGKAPVPNTLLMPRTLPSPTQR